MSTFEHQALHGGADADDAIRRRRATCCTPCWSIFIAIGFGVGLIGNFSTIGRCSGGGCGFSAMFVVLGFIQFLLAVYCAFIYFRSNPSAQMLTWNYTAWIILAIMASTQVILLVILGILIMTSAIAVGAFIPVGPASGGVSLGLGIVGGIIFGAAALVAIPMIINAVLAAKNKVPCQCSGDAGRY